MERVATYDDILKFKEDILVEIRKTQSTKEEPEKKWGSLKELKLVFGGLSDGKIKKLRDDGLLKWKKMGGTYKYNLIHAAEIMDDDKVDLDRKIVKKSKIEPKKK